MTKQQKQLKKEIKKILKETEWKSDYSTHSELADFIIMEVEKIFEKNENNSTKKY